MTAFLLGLAFGAVQPVALACDGKPHAVGPAGHKTLPGDAEVEIDWRSSNMAFYGD